MSWKLTYLYTALVILPLILLPHLLPFKEIRRLKREYPHIQWQGEQTSYRISSTVPMKWRSLDQIDYKAAHAIVVSEDWAFYMHAGVDSNQLKTAVAEYIFGGRALRGASTITQQVVKNLFLSREKSLVRKLKEMVLALYMDQVLEKKRILEIYLNIIEYGEGLYGIADASQFYFGKRTEKLSPREGAFLAMLLPNPKIYASSFHQRSLTPYATKIIQEILSKMEMAHYLTPEEVTLETQRLFAWELPDTSRSNERTL